MAMEQIVIGTKIAWKHGRGRGDRKTLMGKVSALQWKEKAVENAITDTEDPDDSLIIHVDNAVDEYGNPAGNKWFYASQIVQVG